jgi:hypothetical protein
MADGDISGSTRVTRVGDGVLAIANFFIIQNYTVW